MNDDDRIIENQIEYYRARASEYDEWFLREGRYFRGEEHRARWMREIGIVRDSLLSLKPSGRVLDIACGTGLWTQHLAAGVEFLLAVDSSAEALDICKQRVSGRHIFYKVVDIFQWESSDKFDFIFFGFWLSHIPPARFNDFWERVDRLLESGGRIFFVDSRLTQESTAKGHAPVDDSGLVTRKLNDGREFEIVKIFYLPQELEARLKSIGWTGNVRCTAEFFIYGCVERTHS